MIDNEIRSSLEMFLNTEIEFFAIDASLPVHVHDSLPKIWIDALAENHSKSDVLRKIWNDPTSQMGLAYDYLDRITCNLGIVTSSTDGNDILGLLYVCQHEEPDEYFSWLGMPPASETDIEAVQNVLDIRLPQPYVDFAKIHNGFALDGWSSVGPKPLSKLYWIEDTQVGSGINERLLAVSGDGGGNEQCFLYEGSSKLSQELTVNWDHESRMYGRQQTFEQYLMKLLISEAGG